jgi:hypothetical protein
VLKENKTKKASKSATAMIPQTRKGKEPQKLIRSLL